MQIIAKRADPDKVAEVTKKEKAQAVALNDVSASGRKRPWREMKANNKILQAIYSDLSKHPEYYERNKFYKHPDYYKKIAERLKDCSSLLTFKVMRTSDGIKKRLESANFCRVRLCPVCMWRRSLKITSQLRSVIEAEESKKEHSYLFLTLTVPNVKVGELADTLTEMQQAFSKYFVSSKRVKKAVKGWFKATELTYNTERNDWHPHFHCILQVNKTYFNDPVQYIKHADWLDLWRSAMKDDRITMVNVKRIKPKDGEDYISAICETAKYSVKTTDYIDPQDIEWSEDQVISLDQILRKRRFAGWGGSFKDAKAALKLEDEESGDLVHTGEDEPTIDHELLGYESYSWINAINAVGDFYLVKFTLPSSEK